MTLVEDCIFCSIARGDIPANVIARDGEIIAIEDRNPQAPSHALVMPIAHHATIAQLTQSDSALAARLLEVAAALGRQRGAAEGFRLVVNTGPHGGQTVDHVHVHVMAGRPMTWPPG